MTGKELVHKLQDILAEDESVVYITDTLTVPQLLHLRSTLTNALLDAITDRETPCPHDGTYWMHPYKGSKMCGQCGRAIETLEAA